MARAACDCSHDVVYCPFGSSAAEGICERNVPTHRASRASPSGILRESWAEAGAQSVAEDSRWLIPTFSARTHRFPTFSFHRGRTMLSIFMTVCITYPIGTACFLYRQVSPPPKPQLYTPRYNDSESLTAFPVNSVASHY